MSNRIKAIKRINKDLIELKNNPIQGIGIASVDEDIMKYVINMRLMIGPYEGYCVQLLLTFSDNYPIKPPKILIYPNQTIDGNYHRHIYIDAKKDENNKSFKKFCFDLLDNDYMKTNEENSGWNPSYSISSLLLQVQVFLSDPAMNNHVPSDYLVNQLMYSLNNYTRTFTITNEKGEKIKKVHTWKDPYPPMFFKSKEKDNENNINIKNKNSDNTTRLQRIKENLTCFMLKVNYIEDPDILLGYPIISNKIFMGRKTRLELYPIPELLTYEGFEAQKSIQPHMVEQYFDINNQNNQNEQNNQLKAANNEYYNSWLPIYINKDHYEKNKQQILKSIAEITSNQEFKPEQIFTVLPIILNSMIIGISKGKISLSSSFIKCYFHFILLFKKLCQEYRGDYLTYLNYILISIKEKNYSVNKQIIPDIGNFFMVLLFNNLEINNDILKKIYNALFEDLVIRQMFWMFHYSEIWQHSEEIMILKLMKSEYYLNEFEYNDNLIMKYTILFNQDLHDKNIYQNIIDIISNDEGYLEYDIDKEELHIINNFKNIFLKCSREGKNKIKKIILNNLYFYQYFDQTIEESDIYNTFQVHELLNKLDSSKKEEFLKYAFESQKGNQLLLITFFAKKKVEEKGFLDELEKNNGVYLDVDKYIKEMNVKLNEIKNYKDLFEYIGSDFYKNNCKDDLELIIYCYKKALEKGYIGNIRQKHQVNNNLYNSNTYYPRNRERYYRDKDNRYYKNRYSDSRSISINMSRSISRDMSRSRSRNWSKSRYTSSSRNRSRSRDRSRSRSRDRNRSKDRNRSRGRSKSHSRDSY